MATRNVNEAVEHYRKVLRMQRTADEADTRLNSMVSILTHEEFHEYARMTTEIDTAIEVAGGVNASEQVLRSAANQAGRDRA